MIIDGSGRDGETFEADVCVVGAGAAGLTLALDLAKRGVSVVLVESGGLEFQQRSHDLLDYDVSGQTSEGLLKTSRERYFGGTTNHWGGVCQTLDPFEFQHHPWVPHSGWPISRTDLDPWYAAAADLLKLGQAEPPPYNPEALGVASLPRIVAESDKTFYTWIPRHAPPARLRMGRWRLKEVQTHPRVKCLLNTTVVEIHPDHSGERVDSLRARTYEQDTLHFRARDYVLCASAVENARLLLASDSVVPGGLGNAHDLVGRFFMIHMPNGYGHVLSLDANAPLTQEEFLKVPENENISWILTTQAREQFQLQAFIAYLMPRELGWPLAYEAAIKSLVDPAVTAPANPESSRRRGILVNWESAPNPQSRVLLSNRRDALGVRLPLLNLEVTLQDQLRAQKSFELLASAMARNGRARLNFTYIPTSSMPIAGGGDHQIGTTRMANDPRHGVTDINGRVHSVENLFIGGSSLFPTAGWQHPTFTIVALALRQAEFLHARVPAS